MHRVFIFFSRSSDCGLRVNQSNLPARLQTSGGGRSSLGAGFVLPLQIFAPAKRMCHHENFEDRAERIILNLMFGAFVGIILSLFIDYSK